MKGHRGQTLLRSHTLLLSQTDADTDRQTETASWRASRPSWQEPSFDKNHEKQVLSPWNRVKTSRTDLPSLCLLRVLVSARSFLRKFDSNQGKKDDDVDRRLCVRRGGRTMDDGREGELTTSGGERRVRPRVVFVHTNARPG